MKSNWVRLTMAIVAGSIVAAGPASALDVPSVVAVQSKPSSVRLTVSSGPSGAPLGFYIERIKKVEFDALGGWPASPQGSWISGTFTGTPSFNIEGTGREYALAPAQNIEVELGQLFDETGVSATNTDELERSTEYVIRVRANGGAFWPTSDFTPNIVVGSRPDPQDCR